MNLIVAVDKNWGIGCENKLLADIPEDMAFFREKTAGKIVVMGEKTFKSLPNGALPNRKNFVLTLDKNFSAENVTICYSLEEFFEVSKDFNSDDIYVIGGEQIYRLMLPHCDCCYITKMYAEFEADTFMENLDEHSDWAVESAKKISTQSGVDIEFVTYGRKV